VYLAFLPPAFLLFGVPFRHAPHSRLGK
jgi:hypothetical protein